MVYHGAKWWKFDFHTHTPASIDYGKGTEQDILKNRTPREWLLDYMEKGIDCVAVTDHNSGEWIDNLKDELQLMKQEGTEGFRELIIFPGVEVTVNGNIHLLAIFDPSESSIKISNLLSKSEYDGTYGQSDDCTTKSFTEVVEIIHKMKGIAIPAHVDIDRGLFKEVEGTSLKKCLSSDGLLAMQVCDPESTKPKIYEEQKLKLSEVAGSDSHHPKKVGSIYTWVKMEHPNLDALRLALHDGEDGIIRYDKTSINPNEAYKRFFIESIEISNGAKAGRGKNPLKVNFSPWLNTIIGGRGSGKSSLIEYMRLPFDKTRGLPHKLNEEFQEFKKIPSQRGKAGMLTRETKVSVEMQKDGRRISLTWQNDKIVEKHQDESGNWITKDESSNIDSRFPIRIFSQKHLYSLTEDPNYILNIIDQQFNKKEWEEEKEKLISEWFKTRAQMRELSAKIHSKGNIQSELDDVKAKIEIYEESDHKILLDEFQKTQNINQILNQYVTSIHSHYENLRSEIDKAPKSLFSEEKLVGLDQESLEVLSKKSDEYNEIMKEIESALNRLEKLKVSSKKAVSEIPWQEIKRQSEKDYETFVQKLSDMGEKNPNVYSEFVIRKAELEKKLSEIARLEIQYSLENEASQEIYNSIDALERKLRDHRTDVIKKWVGSNENIKMYLNIMGDIESAEETFRSIIRKPGREFAKDILERDDDNVPYNGLLFELMDASQPWEIRNEIIKKLLKEPEEGKKVFGKNFTNHFDNLKASTPEDIDRLIIWYPEDKITLKLVNANKKEEDIETGSAGQRTAAVLSIMLLLNDSPIIIDQPEEDLDTKRISDLVVTGLRAFKNDQQVIVITHNPNIPVNAAAENIVQMNFAGGQIQQKLNGALQNTNVREAICDVMEGGKDALDKRYYRISKALEK